MKHGAMVAMRKHLKMGASGAPTDGASVVDRGTDELLSPLNAKLNPICPLLALLGAHHILQISR
jgi:hypothetical protein